MFLSQPKKARRYQGRRKIKKRNVFVVKVGALQLRLVAVPAEKTLGAMQSLTNLIDV